MCAAKLYFTDVENSEVGPGKLSFGSSLTNMVSETSGTPSTSSVTGAIAIDGTNGIVYRAFSSSSGTGSWEILNSTNGAYGTHQLSVTINAAVISTDGTAPVVGDYVGIFGSGSWALAASISVTKDYVAVTGSQNAGLIAAGLVSAGCTTTELFNGLTWSLSANMVSARSRQPGSGSQNASIVGGGLNASNTTQITTELFNGSVWATAGNMNVSRLFHAPAGIQSAALVSGGENVSLTTQITSEIYNGNTWSLSGNLNISREQHAGFGSLNAAMITGGTDDSNTVSQITSESFNGSTWSYSGNLNTSRSQVGGAGSQYAGLVTGGQSTDSTSAISSSELFNGSTWSFSSNMVISRTSLSGAGGSQNSSLVVTGFNGAARQINSEIHTQSTWRAMTAKSYYVSNLCGILSSTNVVTIQGIAKPGTANISFTYPANVYLVLNRFSDFQIAPNSSLTVIIASVQGGGSNWTYNFNSATTVSNVCPGMIAVATAGGATPFSGGNVGTFIINKVVSPSSIQVINASGAGQNPGTGSLTVLSSVIAKSNPSPDDIVVGYCDNAGILNVIRQPKIGFWSQLLK